MAIQRYFNLMGGTESNDLYGCYTNNFNANFYQLRKVSRMTHTIKKLKGIEYDSYCRDCSFSESGSSYYIVTKAKSHAIKHNHSVEYYTQYGRVYKLKDK